MLKALLSLVLVACLPAGALAVTIDVTQAPYNVVCNGTTDNAAGFQAALDALCPTGSGELKLPSTGTCKIASPIKARCISGLTLIGNENAADAAKPVISYNGAGGTGARAVDLRGVQNFRSAGVAFEATNGSFTGSLIDLTATYTCTNNSLRACDVNADCPGSTCNTSGSSTWASNVYFDQSRFYARCSETDDIRLLWIRHIVNLNIDRSVFRGGAQHIYGVDNDNEWTSVVNLTRNYFYTAGKSSVYNLRWATNSSGNFWQPQGCDQNHARAFDRSAGVTVEGFYSHGDSFWDLAPSNGYTETGPWISISGRDIFISSRFESAYTSNNCASSGVPWACCTGAGTGTCTQIAQAVKFDGGASNGISIIGSYCKNLATCWNLASKTHKNVSISGNGTAGVATVIGGNTLTGCAISTANSIVCD